MTGRQAMRAMAVALGGKSVRRTVVKPAGKPGKPGICNHGCLARRARRCACVAATAAAALCVTSRAQALTINTTYDSTVTGLSYFSSVQSAFGYAVAQYQAMYSDPITINITVSSATTGLGSSNTQLQLNSYSQIRTSLIADAKTSNDIAASAFLPLTDPTGGNQYLVPFAEAKAIGLRTANNTSNDGTFTFNSTLTYTFDPNNRKVAGAYDFIGTAEHEISEIMGRIGILGSTFNINNVPTVCYGPYDLFGFKAAGTRSLNQTDTNAYFSIDNGTTNLHNYNPPGNSGDLRDWASGQGFDAYNAFASTNEKDDISAVDQVAMDVIGYDLTPEPSSFALLSLGALGLLARRRRRA